MRKGGLVAAVLLILFSAGGCWSRKEPNEIAIVQAMGLDRKENRIWLTVQIVRPQAITVPGGAGGAMPRVKPVWTIAVSGSTPFEAVRNLGLVIPRHPIYSHARVLVVGEDLARSGLYPVLDRYSRSVELRLNTWVFVAPGEARRLLQPEEGELERMPGEQIEGLIRGIRWQAKGFPVRIYEFLDAFAAEDEEPFLPLLQLANQQEKSLPPRAAFSLRGTGIFKKDKLVGFFDERETRGLLFLRGVVRGEGSVVVPCPKHPEKKVSLRLVRARSKITPLVLNDRLRVLVEVDEEGDLAQQDYPALLNEPTEFRALERRFAEATRQEILAAVRRARALNSDCLGFGAAFHRKYPKEWRTLKRNWDQWFPRIEVEVRVKARLRRTGLIVEPLM
ncbi:MAG: Ger(x)C family spore germination protein [Firmicutes bacterium]|nr:Ger(x)C family spore germination protein [Bacillota bacterium]